MEKEQVYDLTVQDQGLPPISDETLISLAEQAEKRVAALSKIKKAALSITNPRDWADQNGNPYLQVSGSEKVARIFGISWRIGEPVYEVEEGGHFTFTYKGQFSLAGATIEAIGTRSSKDGFFKKYTYEGTGDNKKKIELPPSEIDKGDVKKAAFTNLLGNGITRILGLRNLTWSDLEEFAKIKKDQVGKVDYKKSGKQQDQHIASEDALTINTSVTDVRKKEGTNKKTNKPYTMFIIKEMNGGEFSTFSETFAKLAKEAKESGRPVTITYKEGQYGKDLENIKFNDGGPGEETGGE